MVPYELKLTAAENAKVHIVQKREQELGHILNCSLTDFSIVEDALYAARKDGAYALLSGFTGCSIIAWAKKLRWMYMRTTYTLLISQFIYILFQVNTSRTRLANMI